MDVPVRFEQDVLLGVDTSPRSIAYCERDGLWVVGTQNGMAVYSAVPTPMLSPLPALPSLLARTQTPIGLSQDTEAASTLDALHSTIAAHCSALRSAMKRKTEQAPTVLLPIAATGAAPSAQSVRVLFLPHTSRILAVQGNVYKLLAPDNGIFPITDVFRMHLRDASCCLAKYLLNIPLEDMCFLLEGIDWHSLLASASALEVAAVRAFFSKLSYTTDISPTWRRALAELPVREMQLFITLVERHVESALAPLYQRGDCSAVPVPLARLVSVIAAAREGLSAMCSTAAARSYNSYLRRLESFGEWQYPTPKISELAAAGLYHDASSGRANVKHFACNSHTFSLANGAAPLEEFFRHVVDRGTEPVGVLHDVPLSRCLNVQPASTFATMDSEPVFLSVDIGTNWVVSVSAKGEVLLLADHPQLSLLTRFHYTCTGEPVDEMIDADADQTGAAAARTPHDASSLSPGVLVGTHLVTDGLPLSNVFVLSALQRGPRDCHVRVHGLLRMICMFAEQAETDADGCMLKCIYCAADSAGHYFPDRASLSAHLMYAHHELMTYSDKHIFTEDSPQFLGDVPVPLDAVYAARVLRKNITCSTCYCGSQPDTYMLLGSRGGQPFLASCSLQPLLCQLNRDKPRSPVLDWHVAPLAGLPDNRPLHSKSFAFGWRSIDDSIAGMSADGAFAFVAWLDGRVWALTHAPSGDRFVDIAYSRELRKIALVTARGTMRLLALEACEPGQQPPDISGPLTLDMLAATRDALQVSRIDISNINSSVSGRVVLSSLPGNDLARPSASFWPMWRPPNPEEVQLAKSQPISLPCMGAQPAAPPAAPPAPRRSGSSAMEWLPNPQQNLLGTTHTAPAAVTGLNEPQQCPESATADRAEASSAAAAAVAVARRSDDKHQGLRITIRMPFVQHVTLVRVECEFELHGPAPHCLPTGLCYSSTNDATTSLAFAIKFNLLDGVPQSSNNGQPVRVRFRKDLRHANLALAATSQVSLHFPQLRPGGLIVPVCFRFCLLGHMPPFAVAKHLAIPRPALLDPAHFSNVPLRLFNMLCDDATPMATRFACIDILMGLLATVKPMGAALVQHADFDKVIETGLLSASFPGKCRIDDLIQRLLEVYPPAGAPLFKAVVRALTSPQLLNVVPLRMFEFMDLVQLIASEDPLALVEALSTRLVDVCNVVSTMAVDVRYAAFLQTHGISPLLLDPGWARIDLNNRMFHDAPLDLVVVRETASTGLVRLTSPPEEIPLARKCYTIQCAPPCQIVFDLSVPSQITSVRMSLVKASAPSARVSLTCGITRARCCEVMLTSRELKPGEAGQLEHKVAGPVQFLTVQVGSIKPESAFELAPTFETPPDGVGYVVPGVDKQGQFVATPVKYKPGKSPHNAYKSGGMGGFDTDEDAPMFSPPAAPALPLEEIIIQLVVYGYPSTDGLASQGEFDGRVLSTLQERAATRDARSSSHLLQLLRNLRFHVETMAFQPHINCNTAEIEALKAFAQTCMEAQDEASIARRQLRRLLGHNRGFLKDQHIPPTRTSKQEQVLVVALSLCRLLQSAPPDAIKQRPLSRQAVVDLIVSACKSCVPELLDAVLEVLRVQPLTVHEWADCVVQVIMSLLPTGNGFVPQRRSTIEALKAIARTQQMGEASCNNPLLLEILAHLIPSDGAADQSMLEAALQVLVDALQAGPQGNTSNSIALCMTDPFLNKVLLHAKRTTLMGTITKALVNFVRKPDGFQFFYNGRELQNTDTPESLGMSNMDVIMLLPAERHVNLVEPISEDPVSARQHYMFLEQGDFKTLAIYEHSSFVSRVLAQVADGTVLEAVSRKGEWLYVRGEGFSGWTLAVRDGVRCLHVIDPAAITEPTWHRVTTNAGQHGLPVRMAPRSGAPLIDRLYVGERLRVIARENDWARITTRTGEEGYALFQKGSIVYLVLDQGHCAQTSNVQLRMLVNLKPGHEPDPDCVCHSRVCLARASCVGDVVARVAQSQGFSPDSLSATFNGQPVPAFATFSELKASHGHQLTVLPTAFVPPGEHLTVRVALPCFSQPAVLKVSRHSPTIKLIAFFARMFDRRVNTFALFHNNRHVDPEELFGTICDRDMVLMELRDVDYVQPDLAIGCFLMHSGTDEVAFNETHITVPKFLFNFWLSPAMLCASRRECFLSLATVIKRLVPGFSLSALLGILKHTRMEQFLQFATTSDPDVQAAVTVVLHSLCNHLRTHFDGQRTDIGVSVVSPHPLMQYYNVLQTVITHVLSQPCSQLGLWSVSRLSFLVALCLPRCGLPPTVRVEYHPHALTLTKRRSMWHCDSCSESYTPETDTIRYRCCRSCDFDVCGACMPFPPPDTVLQPLETATVLQLFAISFSPSNVLSSSTTDLKRMAVLLFTLARTADLMQLVSAAAVWEGMLIAIRLADMAVDLQVRGFVTDLFSSQLTAGPSRTAVLRTVYRAFETIDQVPRLLVWLVDAVFDHTREQTEQGLQVVWQPDHIFHLLRVICLVASRFHKTADVNDGRYPSNASGALVPLTLATSCARLLSCAFATPGIAALKAQLWGTAQFPADVSLDAHLLLTLLLDGSDLTHGPASATHGPTSSPYSPAGPAVPSAKKAGYIVETGRLRRARHAHASAPKSALSLQTLVYEVLHGLANSLDLAAEVQAAAMGVLVNARPDQLDSPVLTLLLSLVDSDEHCGRLAFGLGALEFAIERMRIFTILISNTPAVAVTTATAPASAGASTPGLFAASSAYPSSLYGSSVPPLPLDYSAQPLQGALPNPYSAGPFGAFGASSAARPPMPAPVSHGLPSPRGPLKLLAGLCTELNPATLKRIATHPLARAVCLLLVPLLPLYPSPAGSILVNLARVNPELMEDVLCPMSEAFNGNAVDVIYDVLSLDPTFQWLSHIVHSISMLNNTPSRSRPLITLISRMLSVNGVRERLKDHLSPELVMGFVAWLKSLFVFRHPSASQAKWTQATSEKILLSSLVHNKQGTISMVVAPTARELQATYPNISFDLLIGQTVSVVRSESGRYRTSEHRASGELFHIESPAEFRSIVLEARHLSPTLDVFLSSESQAHDIDCMIAAGLQVLNILIDVLPDAVPAILHAPPSIENTWLVAMLAGSGRAELFESLLDRAVHVLQNVDKASVALVQEQLLCLVCAVVERKNLHTLVKKMQPAQLARFLLHVVHHVPASLQPLARTLVHSCTQCPDTLLALAAEIRLTAFRNPFVMELMLSLHERSIVVCLRPRHIHIPYPAIPTPWLLSDVEFVNPEGLLLRVPASLTLGQLHSVLNSRAVTPSVRTVRTDLDTLVVDGQPLHVGEEVHMVRDGAECLVMRLLAVSDASVWLCSAACPSVNVQIVPLAAIRRGSVVLQRRDTATRATLAEDLASTTLLQLSPATGPLTIVCELDNAGKMFLLPQTVPPGTRTRCSVQETSLDQHSLPTRMPIVHALSATRTFALLVSLATHEVFHTPHKGACPCCRRHCDDVLHHMALSVSSCGRSDALHLVRPGVPLSSAAPPPASLPSTQQYCGCLVPGAGLVLCATCVARLAAQPVCTDTDLRAYPLLQALFSGVIPATGHFETLYAWLERLRILSMVPSCLQVLLNRTLSVAPPSQDLPRKRKAAEDSSQAAQPYCLFEALQTALSGPDTAEVEIGCWHHGVLHFALQELAQACDVLPSKADCPTGNLLTCELVASHALQLAPYRYRLSALTHGAFSSAPKKSYGPAAAAAAGVSDFATSHYLAEPYPQSFGSSAGAYWGAQPAGSRSRTQRMFAAVRSPFPIPRERFYFEVTLENAGLHTMVAIGLHPTGDVDGMVGWEQDSFGLHCDSGTCRSGSSQPPTQLRRVGAGDVVGCGFERSEGLVYFTHNGKLVHGFRAQCNTLYAVVTGSDLAEVFINFGQAPFVFHNTSVTCRDLRGALERLDRRTHTRRKGVGYADDHMSSAQWSSDMHQERTAGQSTLLAAILGALLQVVRLNRLASRAEFAAAVTQSSLTESLAHILLNDSLTDMAKHADLYLVASELVRALSANSALFGLVQPLAPSLRRLADAANNYLQFSKQECSDSDGDELDEVPAATQLARSFLATHAVLQQRASEQPGRMEESGGSAAVSYEEALRPLKLCTARVSATDHDYVRELESIPSRSKMSRLAQELADAGSGLPCTQGNAIFLRVDKQRVDLMQVLITGVSGTPYALGCFVFDVYCPSEYPSVAPKVNLRTTGAGQLRFNPNLYANGKVCLSLLGTWRGSASESWTPDSTLLQVFISIQSLIMTDDVYFNEPGFEHVRGSPEGPRLNRAYSNIVRYGTVRFAMVDQLRSKDSLFADAIKRHFFLNKALVLQQVDEWLRDARAETDADVCYDGIVNSHNPAWAARFCETRTAYANALAEAVSDLHVELAKLSSLPPLVPDGDSDDDDDGE